ncbi:unnamed protein product [Acidithrix sp. C25]|nr:unnamed protein product [Acidithrix sp. C25]
MAGLRESQLIWFALWARVEFLASHLGGFVQGGATLSIKSPMR